MGNTGVGTRTTYGRKESLETFCALKTLGESFHKLPLIH